MRKDCMRKDWLIAGIPEYNLDMDIFLPIVVYAPCAIVIWCIYRLVNRPREWIRYLLAAGAALFVVAALLLSLGGNSRRESPRNPCRDNLRSIGLALINFESAHRSLPRAVTRDANGRAMDSWRVLVLPWLDQRPLFEQYKRDEPWDGPNNSKLADTILPVFNCPIDEHDKSKNPPTMTNYVAVVGPETAWPDTGATSYKDFRDGTSNTILIVEVANSGIHWMEPRDLHVSQMAPTINAKAGQGISSKHKVGAHVLFADGSVRFLSEKMTAAEVQALLTTNGGEKAVDF